MPAHTVEINDSDTIVGALLSSRVPTTVTRHGDTVGVFYPTRRPWTDADRIQFDQTTEQVQQMLQEAGVTAEELMQDYWKLHRAERSL